MKDPVFKISIGNRRWSKDVHFSRRDERLLQAHARRVRVGVRTNQRVRGVRDVPQVKVLPVLGHGQQLVNQRNDDEQCGVRKESI